ncbi:MAG: hypothetical protein IPK21_21800 [Haliscomenobacter sp.]|nr:hypothetical protein [Haliscomenobacter sp.]
MTVLVPDRNITDLNAARFALTELTTPGVCFIANYETRHTTLEGQTLADLAAARRQAPGRSFTWI